MLDQSGQEDAVSMKLIHILAGLIALGFGAVAMTTAKGQSAHRKSGAVFVYTMMIMSLTGAVMAALKPDRASVVAGALAFYMVSTALVTVRSDPKNNRSLFLGLAILGFFIAATAFGLGVMAVDSPKGRLDGYPAGIYFLFGTIALVASILDAFVLRANGIAGKHRLARHLWRMGFALFLAAASFFLGQAKVFPESLRHPVVLATPVFAVVIAVLYWLTRVLRGKRG